MIDEYGNFKSEFFNENQSEFVREPLNDVTLQIMGIENKGTYLEMIFEIAQCSNISQVGKHINDRFSLSKKADFILHDLAKSCGFIVYDEKGNAHTDRERLKNISNLANKLCTCNIIMEDYYKKDGSKGKIAKIDKFSFKYQKTNKLQDLNSINADDYGIDRLNNEAI